MHNEKELFEEPGCELANKPEDKFYWISTQYYTLGSKSFSGINGCSYCLGYWWCRLYFVSASPGATIYAFSISDILATFGAFLAVLIAIEIFQNITLYLKTDVFPVKLVVATALMGISRKVIIFDFKEIGRPFLIGTAAVVLALGITYWLISRKPWQRLYIFVTG